MEYIGSINLPIEIYLTIDKGIYHISRFEKKFRIINLRREYI